MEENKNMNEQTQAESMGNDPEAQGAAGKEQKLFTQEEVNGFVQSRLSRLRGQISKEAKAEYDQKLAELNAREMKLLVRERLHEKGMPKELADIITCTDEADLDSKLEALQKIYGSNAKKEEPTGFIQLGVGYNPASGSAAMPDPVRRAMGLK